MMIVSGIREMVFLSPKNVNNEHVSWGLERDVPKKVSNFFRRVSIPSSRQYPALRKTLKDKANVPCLALILSNAVVR
jgi:hypothetical protein